MSTMARLAGVLVTVLTLTLGFFYVFVGLLNLTPIVNEDIHKELRKEFVHHARVFPMAELLGVKVDPHLYQKAVGMTQVVCGIILAMIPGQVKELANFVLIVMMCGAAYSHYALKEGLQKMMPAIVCGLLLLLVFVLRRSVSSNNTKKVQ